MGLRREGFDKHGAPYEIREQGAECSEELKGMYDEFHPKAESQGLPPAKESDRVSWVEHLLTKGWNFLCRQEGKVVGHSAIIPDRIRCDGEYIVFVLQPYRNKGLGSALTEIGMEKARHEGLRVVWLTVEAFNFRAIRVYRKSGFRFVDEGNGERAMILQL